MAEQAGIGNQLDAAGAFRCPRCGERAAVRILYGMPTPDAVEAAERGELVIAGCARERNDPSHECRACGHRFQAGDR